MKTDTPPPIFNLLDPSQIDERYSFPEAQYPAVMNEALVKFHQKFLVFDDVVVLEYCVRELIDNAIKTTYKNVKTEINWNKELFLDHIQRSQMSQEDILLTIKDSPVMLLLGERNSGPQIEITNTFVPNEEEYDRIQKQLKRSLSPNLLDNTAEIKEGAGLGLIGIRKILKKSTRYQSVLSCFVQRRKNTTTFIIQFLPKS